VAADDAGGDSGMRRLREGAGEVRPVLVVVAVVDDGRFAMTVARTVSGDTPSVAGVQPVRHRKGTTAIAPARGSEGEIMPTREAESTPALAPPSTA